MILEKQATSFNSFEIESFITTNHLLKIMDNYPDFKEKLIEIYKLNINETKVLHIGNAKQLLTSINHLDSLCKKIDIVSKIKDIQLLKLLNEEKSIFEIFSITEPFIIKNLKSDILICETSYTAKADILEYFKFSKFANYCRDNEYEELIDYIKQYLKNKNLSNDELKKLRLLYSNEDKKFYLRAFTSSQDYKDFGINFSIFVAIMSLERYAKNSINPIYINKYVVDDSNVYVSFAFKNIIPINNKLSLTFNLILENDEVKRDAVSFNGIFKLTYSDSKNTTSILLKPKGMKKKDQNFPVDILTYKHRGNVENVFKQVEELPNLINYFIEQVTEDTKKISSIKSPNDIKKYIIYKIKNSRKHEFQKYKPQILQKLAKINVDTTFTLFELLRQVEELFETDDIISLDFWRTKLYECLIERE